MSRRSLRAGFSLVIAFAMALGMLLSAFHMAAGHNAYATAQAEAVRHAELAATIAEHGHAHDEGEPSEKLPGHVHGHNAADHLHETADTLSVVALVTPGFARTSVAHDTVMADPGHPNGLERPPRAVVAA
ncbi:MAG: hypothetical protein GY873_37550 [Bosea sp.]|uniref:hypothetical protein n=1 Tax=Bosea sp. (in: a-proteobacteria) TaxID=1871050 RepID=UPI001D54401E|nr:hypothetical protein [Beijerinckiaceae bacterium]MCP4564138.1 hypothetical protein [Bosea sp. (in: a-proteobacteria)]MCP4739908.1 hypothetical protein [Bosea sp. (in: a-proteobacteria)]